MEIPVVTGLILGGIISLMVKIGLDEFAKNRAKLAESEQAYQAALSELRAYPNDSEKRENALRLGREFSRLSREDNKETVYDELAIKNDIDAACAGSFVEAGRDEVECPSCAELVLRKAVRCKHCGHDLAFLVAGV
ncbi:hypothetical protein Mal15_01740 [Stieleria maiorica]|uniref:Zinc ribbon domain-containing protein n=1 Tax=Stieleria maiorica TaxID=2795974 RepID=A0A5B9M4I9_9BACT|nr:hypothetical protein [Stieleria maiorica]QEF96148.1 hypothetical protein Mal15_01740 [Stieleria maiorica]